MPIAAPMFRCRSCWFTPLRLGFILGDIQFLQQMHQQAPPSRAGAIDKQVHAHQLATAAMEQAHMGGEAKPQCTKPRVAELGD